MPQTYEPISSTTLGSNQATITISSIPSTYTDLIIVARGESTSGGSMLLRPNGDSGSNYGTTYMYGVGSSPITAGGNTSTSGMFLARTGINHQGGGVMHLFNYANTTTYKTGCSSHQFGYDPIVWRAVSTWRSTAAITSINFVDESGGSFTTGFTVCLYGVKNA